MLTARDNDFIRYWEAQRETRSGFSNKLLSGLPMAMLFGLPVLVLIFLVQFFMPQWFNKASQVTQHTQDGQRLITKEFIENPDLYNKSTQFSIGLFITIVIAVLLCIIFYAYFRMHYKWEMNEQLYKELKQKQKKSAAASL
ncbi:MAG: hypothetical protein ABJA78_08405 [Ferruginibacter sp.]